MAAAAAADECEKVNYRSIGRGSGGVLRKRRPKFVRDLNQPTPSTIPAKFETVLYKDNRERKGFGRYTPRFAEGEPERGPGPGDYRPPGSGAACAGSAGAAPGSVGQRGGNAFASRTPREVVHPASRLVPGPGAYEAAAAPSSPRGGGPGRNGAPNPSPVFVLPGSVNPAKFDERALPGPGEYAGGPGTGSWSTRGPMHAPSAHISRTGDGAGRDGVPGVQDTPGPGHYSCREASGPCSAAQLPLHRGSSPLPSSRRLLVSPASELTQLRANALELLEGPAGTAAAVPGPGDYAPQFESTTGPRHFNVRGLSSFQTGTSHLPRTWRPPQPGPGEYDPAPGREAAGPGAVSQARNSFVSASPRFRDQLSAAPGPAYYSPKTKREHKQSFLLNIQKSWV